MLSPRELSLHLVIRLISELPSPIRLMKQDSVKRPNAPLHNVPLHISCVKFIQSYQKLSTCIDWLVSVWKVLWMNMWWWLRGIVFLWSPLWPLVKSCSTPSRFCISTVRELAHCSDRSARWPAFSQSARALRSWKRSVSVSFWFYKHKPQVFTFTKSLIFKGEITQERGFKNSHESISQ